MNEHPLGGIALIRNTGIATFCRGAGVASGLVLDAAVLAYFELGDQTDAFFAALAIPLLVGGMLRMQIPKVLVPMLTHSFREESREATDYLTLAN